MGHCVVCAGGRLRGSGRRSLSWLLCRGRGQRGRSLSGLFWRGSGDGGRTLRWRLSLGRRLGLGWHTTRQSRADEDHGDKKEKGELYGDASKAP